MVRENGYHVDCLFGFRSAHFAEGITMAGSTTFVDPQGAVPVGTVINGSELFSASNTFYGAE